MSALQLLEISALLGAGICAGIFVSFSTAVMRALARVAPAEGIRAMQSINRAVFNPAFMGAFLGTAVLSILMIAGSLLSQELGALQLSGALIFLIGCFAVTAGFNVPLNEELEKQDADSDAGVRMWQRYLQNWCRWNHVRSAACVLSLLCWAFALSS